MTISKTELSIPASLTSGRNVFKAIREVRVGGGERIDLSASLSVFKI